MGSGRGRHAALVAALVFGCGGKSALSDEDRAVVDAYLPKARALAESAAARCANAAGTGAANPHPARGSALDTDPQVLDVEVECWRDKEIWQFLGDDPVLGPQLKRAGKTRDIGPWTKQRIFLAGEFPEGQTTSADHRSEYIDVPAGKQPMPQRDVVVDRPVAGGGWISVRISVAPVAR